LDAVRVVAAGEAMPAPTVTGRLITELARQRPRPAGAAALLAALIAAGDQGPRVERNCRSVSDYYTKSDLTISGPSWRTATCPLREVGLLGRLPPTHQEDCPQWMVS
jgi:hypothetical protein